MTSPLQDICCASLPLEALAALAELRCVAGVEAAAVGERAWLRWPPDGDAVLRCVLPLAGVQLYRYRDGHWYRSGCHLPAFDFPERLTYLPLYQVLFPAPMALVPPEAPHLQPMPLTLAADSRPRRTTALRCDLVDLARWADSAPSACLAAIRAAQCADQVFLLGRNLPLLPSGQRFWGDLVLVPLGQRPDPDLPEAALRAALAITDEELLVLSAGQGEVMARSAFAPLSRTGVRLACREVGP